MCRNEQGGFWQYPVLLNREHILLEGICGAVLGAYLFDAGWLMGAEMACDVG